MGEKRRCIAKRPGTDPYATNISDSLENLQRFVGGYIETCTFEPDWTVICNEEGRLRGLDYNCELLGVDFCGPIILMGVKTNEEGEQEFCDLPFTLHQLKKDIPELWEQ